jgi:gliding motility-associated-like protein
MIQASVSENIAGPVFRWYGTSNKTNLLYRGTDFETPMLYSNTAYYVTLEYKDHCESIYPQAVIIDVEDIERPVITAPEDIMVSTNDGVCYATNVATGSPVTTDNCTSAEQLKITVEPALTEYKFGSTALTWWAEDIAGNKEKAVQTITVIDSEFPQGTCPKDIEVVVNPDIESAIVTYDLRYTDNCSRALRIVRESGLASGSAFPLGETVVRHAVIDTSGNTTVCSFKVNVHHPYRPLEVALRVSSYEICAGEPVTLTPVVSGGTEKYTYSWQPRTWTKAVLEDYPITGTQYEVTVSDGVTSKTKSVDIYVLTTQPVKLNFDGRMDEILEGDEIVVNATSGFTNYKFLLNNNVMQEASLNDQIAFQARLGTYLVRVFATDANYCVSQDQLQIDVESRKLPNVFTPNQDGKNEVFLEGYDLTVFSRSGELLYQGTSGWDGIYRGKLLPQGAYLYVVKRTMINGEQRIYKGNVTLKL